jgi:hypothetical protein
MVLPVFFFASASSVPPEMLPTPVAPTSVASDMRILRMRSAKSALEMRARRGTIRKRGGFYPPICRMIPMSYLFPIPQVPALEDALDIAMDYLERTGQAFPLSQTERFCGQVIFEEWATGRRHRVWLANRAIGAVEQARKANWFRILHEPVTVSGIRS